ncbi:MAG: hypothetical protein FWF46_01460 [Oscillospiraceae bacterium]|nr:hypothetical protein [Oscillospiraceae bacterium]
MKKTLTIVAVIIIAILMLFTLTGCGKQSEKTPQDIRKYLEDNGYTFDIGSSNYSYYKAQYVIIQDADETLEFGKINDILKNTTEYYWGDEGIENDVDLLNNTTFSTAYKDWLNKNNLTNEQIIELLDYYDTNRTQNPIQSNNQSNDPILQNALNFLNENNSTN